MDSGRCRLVRHAAHQTYSQLTERVSWAARRQLDSAVAAALFLKSQALLQRCVRVEHIFATLASAAERLTDHGRTCLPFFATTHARSHVFYLTETNSVSRNLSTLNFLSLNQLASEIRSRRDCDCRRRRRSGLMHVASVYRGSARAINILAAVIYLETTDERRSARTDERGSVQITSPKGSFFAKDGRKADVAFYVQSCESRG